MMPMCRYPRCIAVMLLAVLLPSCVVSGYAHKETSRLTKRELDDTNDTPAPPPQCSVTYDVRKTIQGQCQQLSVNDRFNSACDATDPDTGENMLQLYYASNCQGRPLK